MTVSKSDIASKVLNRYSGIPSAVTSTIIQEWVEDCHIVIENSTGDSFTTSDIPIEYQALITDMTVIYLLDYLITGNVSLGDFSMSFRELIAQKKLIEERVERQLSDVVRNTASGLVETTEPSL